jgi:hypothetical protein
MDAKHSFTERKVLFVDLGYGARGGGGGGGLVRLSHKQQPRTSLHRCLIADGGGQTDIATFIHRLDKVIVQFRKQAPLTAGPPRPLTPPAAGTSRATTDGTTPTAVSGPDTFVQDATPSFSRQTDGAEALGVLERVAAVCLESSDDEEAAS